MNPSLLHAGPRRLRLDASMLAQYGGEGSVYLLPDQAVKLYHLPTPHQVEKLRYWQHHDLGDHVPQPVYAPLELVHDGQGHIVGFTMDRLPTGWQALHRLSQPLFATRFNLGPVEVVDWLCELSKLVEALHRQHIIIGDLNDRNIFFDPSNKGASGLALVDVDSFQVGGLACPVALPEFLDPRLYGVADLAQNPVFSTGSDWYAFCVLLVKCLLQVHPFGGSHPIHKTLAARVNAGLLVTAGSVTYPLNARPPEVMSTELWDFLEPVWHGQRRPVPRQLLRDYQDSLEPCPACQVVYPTGRQRCPACRRRTPQRLVPTPNRGWRELLVCHGRIVEVAWRDGRYHVVSHENGSYHLQWGGPGGIAGQQHLFDGQPGYRFHFYGPPSSVGLAVCSPGRNLALLLDSRGKLQERLESDTYLEDAVLAGSSSALYRLANGYLLRGQRRNQGFVEEIIGSAYFQQTRLWGSPWEDAVAGVGRNLGALHFFLLGPDAPGREGVVPLPAGGIIRDMGLGFFPTPGENACIAILLHLEFDGRRQLQVSIVQDRSDVDSWSIVTESCPDLATSAVLKDGSLLAAGPAGLHRISRQGITPWSSPAAWQRALQVQATPEGILIRGENRLWYRETQWISGQPPQASRRMGTVLGT